MDLRTSFKTQALSAFFLLVGLGLLAACGSSPASTTTGSATSPGNGANGAAGRFRPVTGTVSQYNAAAKALTMKLSNGSMQTFTITNARIIQDQKIMPQQLSTLLSKSGIVVFAIGKKASDGTYTAQEIVASTTMGGTANGTGVQGRAPQATRRNGGNRVFIQNGKLQNNQLVGDDTSGHPITVHLNGTTVLLDQSEATASDLQAGQTVSVVAGSRQGSSTNGASQVVIGPLPGNGAGA